MTALPTRHIEHPRASRQAENLDEPRHVAPVALRREQRLVLAEILAVEVGRPPVDVAECGHRRRSLAARVL